ncbi:hypothetical protein C0Z16_30120 [Paraburkholderia rhynchosiae]|nr:hypothetical protein C0Z16_30120 [Paraburkholderia rhynchosiae]
MLRGTPRTSTTVAPAASPAASTGAGVPPASPGTRASVKASFTATRERFRNLLGFSRPPYATREARSDRRALVETEWRLPFTRANKFGRPFPAHAVRIEVQKPARPLDPPGDWSEAGKAAPAPGSSASAQRRAAKASRMLAKTIGKFTAKRADTSTNAAVTGATGRPRDEAELQHWLDHREGLDSWVREYFSAAGRGGEGSGGTANVGHHAQGSNEGDDANDVNNTSRTGRASDANGGSYTSDASDVDDAHNGNGTNDANDSNETIPLNGGIAPADPLATLSALLAQAAQGADAVHGVAGGVAPQADPSAADSTLRFAPSLMLGYAVLSALGSNEPARAAAALQALPEVARIEGIVQRVATFDANAARPTATTETEEPQRNDDALHVSNASEPRSEEITHEDVEGITHEGDSNVRTPPAANHTSPQALVNPAHEDAWRIARALANTHLGFDVLKKLTGSAASTADNATALAVLQAWNALPEPRADLDAALIAAHAAADDKGNLAPRVLRAVSGSTQPRDAAALFAWRQGFRSDAPGSPLKQTQTRLHRFVTRGMLRLDKGNWFFQRMFGKKKSALRGMMLGTSSAALASYTKEAARYAGALKTASATLASSLRSPRLATGAPDGPEARAREAAAAALEALAARPAAHIGDLELDETTIAALENREPVVSVAQRDDAPLLLDAGALRDCAKRFQVHRWEAVKTALDHVDKVGEAKALKPERLSREAIRSVMRQVIIDLQQSTQVSFADGGRFGFSTRGLSLSVNKGPHHHLPVGGELTLAHYHSRRAVVTLQRNNVGFDIFIGTEHGKRSQARVGGRLGYSKHMSWLGGLRLGGSLRLTPFDRELREPRGVMIRVARERLTDENLDWVPMKYDDARTTETVLDMVEFLFEEAREPVREKGAETPLFERLAARIGERTDISIGWQEGGTRATRQGIAASAGASVSAPSSSVRGSYGLDGNVTVDLNSSSETYSNEATGSIRYDRRSTTSSMRVSAQGTAGASPGWHKGELTGGLPGASPLGVGGARPERLVAARVMLPEREGRLLNRGCYADQQFASFNAFAAAVQGSREEWIEMYRHNHGCDYPEAAAKLKHDLAMLQSHQRINHTFLVRRRLKPAQALRGDVYRALERMHEAAAHAVGGKGVDWSRPLDTLLRERASWLPERIAVSEVTGRVRSTPGLRLPIGGVASESVLAQRELLRSKA